jgi:DNA primase
MDMTAGFDDTAKEEIRLRADIAAVVGRYVKLKSSGQTLKGLCPFHKEKTPSFHVNPSRGFFHCFGCGKGGDVFKFLQEIESLTFPEVLKMLSEETGVELPKTRQVSTVEEDSAAPSIPKQVLVDIHKIAADFYYGQIRGNSEAVDYFKSRGLAAETVRDFKLGYAPPGWSSLLAFCAKKNISADALVACGLAIKKEDGSAYDRFRDRVMFSLVDLSNRVIGFAGRGRNKEVMPKYLNSPETPIYRKKEFLYGLNITRQYIKDERFVMVVEGYMDFLTLYQAGIRNIVATSGTAMTPEHVRILQRFAPKVMLVFDGDDAGQTAAERGIFTLAPFDLDVSILVLPPEEDPDSFVKEKGPDEFRSLMAGAKNADDFIIERLLAQNDGARTPRSQKAVIERLAPLAQAMTNPLAKARFKKELSERLGIDEKTVQTLLASGAEKGIKSPQTNDGAGDELYLRTLEGSFLHMLVTQPELIHEARRYVAPETLTDTVSTDIYYIILASFDENGNLDGIIDRANDPEVQRRISRMLVAPALEEHIHEEMVQKIIHLRSKFLKARIRSTRIQLKSETDSSRKIELTHQINDDLKQLRNLDEGE